MLKFLLTHLIRGMTRQIPSSYRLLQFLPTRLIRGMTRTAGTFGGYGKFLLTRLIRGMTLVRLHKFRELDISTHTPHTRHDEFEYHTGCHQWDFYSHASYEA